MQRALAAQVFLRTLSEASVGEVFICAFSTIERLQQFRRLKFLVIAKYSGRELHRPTYRFLPDVLAQVNKPFYQQWWFLVIAALIGLILITVITMILCITGRNIKANRYKGTHLMINLANVYFI